MERTTAGSTLELPDRFEGEQVTPDHPEFDATRAIFNAMIDIRPALIARCESNQDVVDAIALARSKDVPLSVRAGGHGVAGFALCDGGIVIDLRPMNHIDVDPANRTARAHAGATWGELDAATQAFGLATTGGRVSTTGIAGLTLGSGSGWLERAHGFTPDNLLSVELVTADGEVVTASEHENADLFWALRGGGGNFGVATSFEYRLHPVGPVLFGGKLMYRGDQGPSVVRAWRDFMEAAPEEVGSGLVGITAPPLEFVPEDLQGRPAIGIVAGYFGPVDAGEEALRLLRGLDGLAVDGFGPLPYTAFQQLIDDACPPGQRQYWKSENLAALSDGAIDAYLGCAADATSPSTQFLLEAKVGGACRRVEEDATPLSRQAMYTYGAFAVWDDPVEDDVHIDWARRTSAAMEPFAIPGVVLNYTSDTSEQRVRSTYGPDKYRRLVEVKGRWDPDNVFRSNQNIAPGAGAA